MSSVSRSRCKLSNRINGAECRTDKGNSMKPSDPAGRQGPAKNLPDDVQITEYVYSAVSQGKPIFYILLTRIMQAQGRGCHRDPIRPQEPPCPGYPPCRRSRSRGSGCRGSVLDGRFLGGRRCMWMRSFRFFGFCMIGLMDRFSTIRKGYGGLWSFEVIYKTATAGYKVYIRKSKVENLG